MNNTLVKNKNFILLMFGQFVSLIGTEMQDFALALYVLKLTGSGKMFASVLAVTLIPRIILGPVCGVFADWFDKKKIIVAMDALSGITTAILFTISLANGLQLYHIYGLVIVLSLISSLLNPTIGAVIPLIVDKENLIPANSTSSFIMTIGSLLAPVLAGIVFGKFGITVILLINSISFFISAFLEIFISIAKSSISHNDFTFILFKKDFVEGIKCINNTKILRNLMISILIINLFFNPVLSVCLPYISKIVLKISDIQFGLLNTLMVTGGLVGSVLLGIISKKFKIENVLITFLIFCGILTATLSFNSSKLFLSLFKNNTIPFIFLAVNGLLIYLSATIINISISTIRQEQVPIELLGRVGAVCSTIAMSIIPIGQMLYGLLLDKMSACIPIAVSGVILILMTIMFKISVRENNSIKINNYSVDNENLSIVSPKDASAIDTDD